MKVAATKHRATSRAARKHRGKSSAATMRRAESNAATKRRAGTSDATPRRAAKRLRAGTSVATSRSGVSLAATKDRATLLAMMNRGGTSPVVMLRLVRSRAVKVGAKADPKVDRGALRLRVTRIGRVTLRRAAMTMADNALPTAGCAKSAGRSASPSVRRARATRADRSAVA
jgi:hypothetical protein